MMVPRMQHVLVRVLLLCCVCCVVNAVISPEEVQQLLRERLVPVNMTLFQQAVDNHLMTLTHVTDGLTTTTTAVLVGAHQVSEVHFSRDLDWHE
jgi:hypothetical protein